MTEQLLIQNLTNEQSNLFEQRQGIRPCSSSCFRCQELLDNMVREGEFDTPVEPTPQEYRLDLDHDDLGLLIMVLKNEIELESYELQDFEDQEMSLHIYGRVIVYKRLIELRNRLVDFSNAIIAEGSL